MITESARIPSVAATIRRYALFVLIGEPIRWRHAGILLVAIGLLVLAVPRFDTYDQPPLISFMVICILTAAGAGHREYRFGGPARLVAAAGVSTFLAAIALYAVIFAASSVFGPKPESALIARFWSLPTDLLVGAFVAFAVLLVILYWVRRPARAREEAAFRERVRVERAARGKAPRM